MKRADVKKRYNIKNPAVCQVKPFAPDESEFNHEPFDKLRTCFTNYAKKVSLWGFDQRIVVPALPCEVCLSLLHQGYSPCPTKPFGLRSHFGEVGWRSRMLLQGYSLKYNDFVIWLLKFGFESAPLFSLKDNELISLLRGSVYMQSIEPQIKNSFSRFAGHCLGKRQKFTPE